MSDIKACVKQTDHYTGKQPDEGSVATSRDTTSPENEVHSSDHTHRKSMRLKDMPTTKQAGGKRETKKGEHPAAQKKRTLTTRQSTQKQPFGTADAPFPVALESVPPDDWCRTWATGRTIMLRRTSKTVTELVDKMLLSVVVRLSRSLWDFYDSHIGTGEAKRQFV